MKKVMLIACMLIAVIIVQAKDNESKSKDTDTQATMVLTGSVVDGQSGESLVGVEVKLAGTDKKTYTDFDGNFNFENIKPGEYKIETNYISYQQKAEKLTIATKENKIKIKLQSSN
ncbi:carboxypeptidase-like regulatory domain-containing protein [Maribellus sediminis]|uniref:carboxypeptidase-like regulatory domain-containing protein n=1 Tax=Maribellus sediminis TaxID=2696285 RepID=UPI001430A87C|nr:carboxypeptidase-like regulatory domain-containing protein [Maribellus sediminis]